MREAPAAARASRTVAAMRKKNLARPRHAHGKRSGKNDRELPVRFERQMVRKGRGCDVCHTSIIIFTTIAKDQANVMAVTFPSDDRHLQSGPRVCDGRQIPLFEMSQRVPGSFYADVLSLKFKAGRLLVRLRWVWNTHSSEGVRRSPGIPSPTAFLCAPRPFRSSPCGHCLPGPGLRAGRSAPSESPGPSRPGSAALRSRQTEW